MTLMSLLQCAAKKKKSLNQDEQPQGLSRNDGTAKDPEINWCNIWARVLDLTETWRYKGVTIERIF